MIDFSKIHSFNQGQRSSFEELICQLGRLELFPEHSVFKRIEGAGGDGGVEAYWTKSNGMKTAYQAKYFLRCGEVDWRQIDKSVTQALSSHPELECYVIALPCDLTDRTGKKKNGQTGWQHWETHERKWQQQAIAAGIEGIKFLVWPRSELIARLSQNESKGLREFFFGDVPLSIPWFRGQLQEVKAALDERFHPEDHVDVRVEKLFSVISRTPSFRKELLDSLSEIKECGFPDGRRITLPHNLPQNYLEGVRNECLNLLSISDQILLDPQHSWQVGNWCNHVTKLIAANEKLQRWFWENERKLNDASSEKFDLRACVRESRNLDQAVEKLDKLLRSPFMEAEKKRIAFIRGNAGSGKSHLLAKCAENAIANDQPVVLLLGQRINDGDLWIQIAQLLGWSSRSGEELLAVLDTAGKSVGVRTLLLIDAINEGAGSKYWRNQLASLIHKLNEFSHISCVISCRSEYFDLAVPDAISKQYSIFDIRGFETPQEQLNAARVYLDRRGIARPSTPWLSPEFINPLFLRSVCLSLERDNKSEFPAGLTGTQKILKYYLDSIGRNITKKESSTISLVPNLARAVRSIVMEMLNKKEDFLEIDICRAAIATHFSHIHSQTESDWLSVFLNNGLLRKDPHPSANDDYTDEDVVRFSFQRFQDFLMAEQLLLNVNKNDCLFGEGGPINFCIEGNHIAYEWRGLIDALAVVLPEKLETELVDALPGGAPRWWSDWSIQEAFAESVKWRARSAFYDRTLELLNDFGHWQTEPFELLLQIAVSADHPWNAELLDKNLLRRKLSDRDVFWTTWVNTQSDDVDSCVGILIEWCRIGQAPHTNSENQFLAALMLCWFFTSTNRAIRDKSTKALTNIMLANEDIFPKLLIRFAEVDDLYVLERLLGAAYGSCCLKSETQRLMKYSESIFEHIFKEGSPPFGLLLRDYAFGIIELANYHSALPSSVTYELCKPPYKSPNLRLTVSEKQLENISKMAGDNEIVRSATGFMGDFSSYEIGPRAGHFLRVPLNKNAPLSGTQRIRVFTNLVIGHNKERMRAFERLEKIANPYSYGLFSGFGRDKKTPKKNQINQWHKDLAIAENSFLTLLTKDEVKLFHSHVAPSLYQRKHSNIRERKFDLQAIKRWIAKRAYDYGWTKAKFGEDSSSEGRHSRDRPSIERIGKKYQWLALDELLSRLADNFWLEGEYGNLPKPYESPLDIGFHRDIDPTVIEENAKHNFISQTSENWVFEPWIMLDKVDEAQLTAWPFEKNPSSALKTLPYRTDPNGVQWLVIYEHQSKTEKYVNHIGDHGLRIQEFRFLGTVMIKVHDAKEIAENFKAKSEIDMLSWVVPDVTDAAFLHESPWRHSWNQEKWLYDSWRLPTGVGYAQFAAHYAWESHLDAALPEGYSSHLPSPWLAQKLNLFADPTHIGMWRDNTNEIVFREFKGEEGGSACLLRMDKMEELIGTDCTFLSVLISERNTWPSGSNTNAAWRRAEGVCWRDGSGVNAFNWYSDHRNGDHI